MSPALAGRFLSTLTPGKPSSYYFVSIHFPFFFTTSKKFTLMLFYLVFKDFVGNRKFYLYEIPPFVFLFILHFY